MAGHIFISYSKRDAEFALELAANLEKAGFAVWIDRQIEGGERWRTSIIDALRNASEAIVVLSPYSVTSKWVQHEGSMASGLDVRIYPVLMEPVNELPVWMEELQYIDFHTKNYDDAFDELVTVLTPPNPLQDLLDQRVDEYRQTGDLIGEALLMLLEDERSTLTVSDEAEILIEKSQRAVKFRRRLVRASAGVAIVFVVVAIIALVAAGRAGNDVLKAQAELATAQTEAAIAGEAIIVAEAQATTAGAFQATAEANIIAVETQQAEAQIELATAAVAISEANLAMGEAQSRIQRAETQLVRLFETTGTIPIGQDPDTLLWNGTSLWIANRDGALQQINPQTGMVEQSIALYGTISDLAWDGTAIWVGSEGDTTVKRIDPVSGDILATVDVGGGQSDLVWDGVSLWAAQPRENTIRQIAVTADGTWSAAETLEVGEGPEVLLMDSNNQLWVANRTEGTVRRVNPTTGAMTDPIEVGQRPAAMAWDGRTLWVANKGDGNIVQLDPINGEILQSIEVAEFPSALLWDGANLWVSALRPRGVFQVDPTSGEVLSVVDAGRLPGPLAWDGQNLWALDQGDEALLLLDVAQSAVQSTQLVDMLPNGAVLSNGDTITLASETLARLQIIAPTDETFYPQTYQFEASPTHIVWTGNRIWISRTDGSVQPISPQTGIAPAIAVAYPPGPLAWDGETVWVASPEENVIFGINPFSGSPVGDPIIVHNQDGFTINNLIWDGEQLWVASTSNNGLVGNVMRLKPNSRLRWSPTEVGRNPSAMIHDGNALWVVNSGSNSVSKIMADGTVRTTESGSVGDGPVALAWDGESIWVANYDGSTVQQIDPISVTVQATVPVDQQPIALLFDVETLWVITESGTLQTINRAGLNQLMTARRLSTAYR